MKESNEEGGTAPVPEDAQPHAQALETKCAYCDSPMLLRARVCVNCNRDKRWFLNYFRGGDLLLLVSILVSFGMVYLSYQNFHEAREEHVKASEALKIASKAESIVIKGHEQLQQIEAANEEARTRSPK